MSDLNKLLSQAIRGNSQAQCKIEKFQISEFLEEEIIDNKERALDMRETLKK